jgi:hypothetical protein
MKFESVLKRHFFYDMADPRIRNRFCMGSALPVIAWSLFYFVFVKFFLQRFMKTRKTYNVRSVSILVYTFYTAAHAFMIFKLAPYWLTKYNWRCEPVDKSHSKDALEVTFEINKFKVHDSNNELFCYPTVGELMLLLHASESFVHSGDSCG